MKDIKNKEEKKEKRESQLKERKIKIQKEQELTKQMCSLVNLPVLRFNIKGYKQEFQIHKPSFSVGRDLSNDLSIPNPHVSKKHFLISFANEKFKLQDNQSTNGVLVNGKKISETILSNGDIIQIGKFSMTFLL